MVCLECGKTVRCVSYKHLMSCSGISASEYKSKHPNTPLQDDDVRLSYINRGNKNGRWKGLSNRTCKCGKKISRHAWVKQCNRCAALDKIGKMSFPHTDIDKNKMKLAASKRDPSTYKPGMCKINSKTSIENKVSNILDKLSIKHERNVRVGRFIVDILIHPNLAIECNGNYWHCNPAIYSSDYYNKSLHMTSDEKWSKDLQKKDKLESGGYRVISFWESEINNNPDKIEMEILDAI